MPFILMLKTMEMKLMVENLELITENSSVDRVSNTSETGKAKSWVNFQAKLSKSKNKIKLCLAKF